MHTRKIKKKKEKKTLRFNAKEKIYLLELFWVELKEAAGSALLKVPLGSLSGRKAD